MEQYTIYCTESQYRVCNDVNANGKDFVRICTESEPTDSDLCLDANQCRELARVLNFMADEIESR